MDEPALVRRLTTIMSIDVVGFSTLSARNEEHALDLLGVRMATAETIIKHHRGRVFKLTGDGLLAEFVSPVEAVRAALEVQEAMRSANATAGADDQLVLRIGINLGDIVESGDDLMGDAVNVAVRLESIAPHGGICVSSSIYEQIVGKLTLSAEDMGEQHVKNIPRPIHAYRLTPGSGKPAIPLTAPPSASRRASRLLLTAGAITAMAIMAVAAGWLARERTEGVRTPLQTAQPSSASPVPAGAAPTATPAAALPASPAAPSAASGAGTTPPSAVATRYYRPEAVPFVSDSRRRALENYARAENSKAMALNARGIFAVATRRIDFPTARRIAMEECNRLVKRDVPVVREFDRCMTYAVGNEIVWSFNAPPMPPPPYIPATRLSPPITLEPTTMPLIGETGRRNLAERYLKSDRRRALAMGRNRFEWWSSSDTEPDAIRRTLQTCGHVTGRPCVVLAVEDQLLVRIPQRYQPVDIFTPQDITSLDAGQQAAVERYLIADDWRAIAVGRNGRMGIVVNRASESAAANDAVAACARSGGTECAISVVGPFLVAPN